MNTYQLEAVMTEDLYSRDAFVGVFPMDLLPKNQVKQWKRPFCLIVNSAPSSSQGEHWLAVYVDEHGVGELFDSYGHSAEFYDQRLETFLKKNCSEHSFNTRELQTLWSDTCGQFCLYHLLFRCRQIPANDIIKQFSRNKVINDHMVDGFIHRHFPSVFNLHENTFTRMFKNKQQLCHSRLRCTSR